VRTQHALDSIERTTRDRDVVGCDPVCFKLRRRERDQRTELERIAIETRRGIQRLEMRGQQRQQLGIRVARGEIERAIEHGC
jgi:hypothetical protein